MRVSREQAAENRDRVLEAAGTAVPGAGLRRGRCRRHHGRGRPDPRRLLWPVRLQGRPRGRGLRAGARAPRATNGNALVATHPDAALAAIVDSYLSPGIASDPRRELPVSDPRARRGAAGRRRQPDLHRGAEAARRCPRAGRARADPRRRGVAKALATMASLVGAVVLAARGGRPGPRGRDPGRSPAESAASKD